jgi:hypothetical protein
LFAILSPFFVDQINSEVAQVIVLYLAAVLFGYYVGHVLAGRPPSTYAFLGSSLGLVVFLALLVYLSILYPGVEPLYLSWFIRFGVGLALVFIGGAFLGDLVARQRVSIGQGLLAAIISFIGTLIGIAFSGS